MAGECGKFIISWRHSETSSEPKEPDMLISSFLRPVQAEGNQLRTQNVISPIRAGLGKEEASPPPTSLLGRRLWPPCVAPQQHRQVLGRALLRTLFWEGTAPSPLPSCTSWLWPRASLSPDISSLGAISPSRLCWEISSSCFAPWSASNGGFLTGPDFSPCPLLPACSIYQGPVCHQPGTWP